MQEEGGMEGVRERDVPCAGCGAGKQWGGENEEVGIGR